MLVGITLFSAVSFLCFGVGYLTSARLRAEFTRYGLARRRVPIACLQLAGAAGQIVGMRHPPLGAAAAASLSLMMAVAIAVRLRVGDAVARCVPAAFYLLLDAALAAAWLCV